MNSDATAGGGLRVPALYIVTDRRATAGRPLIEVITRALEGAAEAGVTAGTVAVQLREKDLEGGALLRLAQALRALTATFGAGLYINDRVDVALAAGADGVHLGGGALAPADVSAIAPALAVAVSTHGSADVEQAARAPNVRFAVLGPIFDTPAKRRFGPPLGLATLAATAARPTTRPGGLPILAIGGVTVENQPACLAAGAAGVALIRAIVSAPDPKKIAFGFCQSILGGGPPREARDLT